jgi:CRP/FNR family transcriptional regulator, cyclic AMP receptor protein
MRMNLSPCVNIGMLAALPFFKGLSTQHLETLVKNAMCAEFSPDEIIFREGESANRFYIILEGQVALESTTLKRDDEREPELIQTLGPDDLLGWSWMFPPYCWHFNARAITAGKVIFFYGTRLHEECENNHDLGYELMKRVAETVVHRLQATRLRLLEQRKNPLLPM